jgi:hypothetical protein
MFHVLMFRGCESQVVLTKMDAAGRWGRIYIIPSIDFSLQETSV